MSELTYGSVIPLTDGKTVVVDRLLGAGGQGMVYLCKSGDKEYALKWYKQRPSEAFRQNLMKNVDEGAPSDSFIWPLRVTKVVNGSFGYVMHLRPQDHREFGEFRLAHCRFGSWQAVITAAMQICEAFKALHAKGLSYQDLNDGNFFIHPSTGHVLICDNDNVFPNLENSGILGKARYMAPEVVAGKTLPNNYSDRFSLSVVLFMLFCIDHPFEGREVCSKVCLTEEIEREVFAHPLFIYDPDDQRNQPVRGVHRNVMAFWPQLPEVLHQTFVNEFSKETLEKPEKRFTELQWLNVLQDVRDRLVRCPHCGDETFVGRSQDKRLNLLTHLLGSKVDTCLNPKCGFEVKPEFLLTTGHRQIAITSRNCIYLDRDSKPEARVIHHPINKDVLLLQNLTDKNWEGMTPSGKPFSIAPQNFVPVKNGITLQITTDNHRFDCKIKGN